MDTAIDVEAILVEVIGGYRQRYIEKNGPCLVIAFNLGPSCSILPFNIHIHFFSYLPSTFSFLIRNMTSFPKSPRPTMLLSSLRIRCHPSSD